MTTRWVSCGLIVSMAVITASCALITPRPLGPHSPPVGPALPCNPGVCEIQVTVVACGATCCSSVDKPFVAVDTARNMRWTIVTPGHVFASNGIAFDPPDPQFAPQHSPRPNEFRIHNAKASSGDFAYYVNVQGCEPLDPWVRNQ